MTFVRVAPDRVTARLVAQVITAVMHARPIFACSISVTRGTFDLVPIDDAATLALALGRSKRGRRWACSPFVTPLARMYSPTIARSTRIDEMMTTRAGCALRRDQEDAAVGARHTGRARRRRLVVTRGRDGRLLRRTGSFARKFT